MYGTLESSLRRARDEKRYSSHYYSKIMDNEPRLNIDSNSHSTSWVRARIRVSGIVQGVGFRPFVFRLASRLNLSGTVCNKGGTVEIELRATQENVVDFIHRLKSEAPPVARVDCVELLEVIASDEIEQEGNFEIVSSKSDSLDAAGFEVPPDIATCEECLAELFDRDNRRYRYPFLNCTNCGPRFTVIEGLPYDRAATSMDCFLMCQECHREYTDPRNRRFHAQPNGCMHCGPRLAFFYPEAQLPEQVVFDSNSDLALKKTVTSLSNGYIVAIKGLGGFHLVCDATNNGAVSRLRKLKGRDAKPFAIMMPSVEYVRKYCDVSSSESAILEGQFRPIVLLKKHYRTGEKQRPKLPCRLSDKLAPQLNTLGVMLPYTPLQHLLLRDFGRPLVMTSANYSEEPIVTGNREAIRRLSSIADAFLFNNRDITSRYDDTVTRVMNGSETLVRRARGYAPRSIDLAFRATVPVLSMGGHLKNTFCLIKDTKAYVSQHIGDLDTLETTEHFENTLRTFLDLFEIAPELIAVDMHPDYGSTRLSHTLLSNKSRAPFRTDKIRRTISVQHHHAHIASCMAEHRINQPVIGVAFDGIGYGTDQNLWGGEFFRCTFDSFDRLASFRNIRMPGGVSAIKEPWRMALSYLASCSKGRNSKSVMNVLDRFNCAFGKDSVSTVYLQLAKSEFSPKTSSCGRLFDAVSALLGLCEIALYEGQAAIALESCITDSDINSTPQPYSFKHNLSNVEGIEIIEIDTISIFESVLDDLHENIANPIIAARFHDTIAAVVAKICDSLRTKSGINTVCLSGGVFQNERLLCRTTSLLNSSQFDVFTNNLVPCNDGGLSLGQAAVALAQANMLEI